ncbi:MAG: vsr [Firmicutes bacterium]|nr:vsr [Bacillota bacterium]
MSKIGGKDSAIEMRVRRLLFSLGYRYRLHVATLPGKPDIVFPGRRKVVFVHGCFWHRHEGCRRATVPDQNADFWRRKIERNVARDKDVQEQLKETGWSVLVIWGCEVRRDTRDLEMRLRYFLEG